MLISIDKQKQPSYTFDHRKQCLLKQRGKRTRLWRKICLPSRNDKPCARLSSTASACAITPLAIRMCAAFRSSGRWHQRRVVPQLWPSGPGEPPEAPQDSVRVRGVRWRPHGRRLPRHRLVAPHHCCTAPLAIGHSIGTAGFRVTGRSRSFRDTVVGVEHYGLTPLWRSC